MNGAHGKLKAIAVITILIASGLAITPFIVQKLKQTNESAGGNWWNSDWQYYKVLPINNQNNSYQMRITVGKSTGGNVTCEGHCRDDFGDIRFLDVDNSTQLSYWLENYTSGINATFWVNVAQSAESDQQILMYYGNGFVTSVSNPSATWDYWIEWTSDYTSSFTHSSAASNRRHSYNIDTGKQFNTSNGFRILMNNAITTASYTNTYAVGAGAGIGQPINKVFGTSLYGTASEYATDWYLYMINIWKNGTSNQTDSSIYVWKNQVSNATAREDSNLYNLNDWNVWETTVCSNAATYNTYRGKSDGQRFISLNVTIGLPTSNIPYFGYYCNAGDTASYNTYWGYDSTNKAVTWGGYASGRCTIIMENKWSAIGKYKSTEPSWGAIGSEQSNGARAWANAGVLYSKKITIDHTKIIENLTNFPILINYTSSDFLLAQANGNDICFYSVDNLTKYNHEIEYFNRATGILTAWVNVTSIRSDIDTIIYMYYGNTTCGSQQNKYGTWNSDYVMVLHMNGSAYTTITDSTIYSNSVTGVSGSPTYQQTGKVGYGVSFSSAFMYESTPVRNTTPMTVECWTKPASFGAGNYYLSTGIESTGGGPGFTMDYDGSSGKHYIHMGNSSNGKQTYINSGTSTAGTWYYHGMAWTGQSTDNGSFFVQDVKTSAAPTSQNWTGNSNLYISVNAYSQNYPFTGIMDEIRISKVSRSDGWLNASYNNQNSPSTFESFGNQQGSPYGTPWYNTDWKYCKKITIDHTKVAENLTNFPILFSNISADFKRAQSTGNDFVFVDAINTTKYNHEIETFNSTTGELVVWINVTYLSCINDTILYLYYGNPTCSNQQNKVGTWDSNYIGVYHMNETSGTTCYDSTNNVNGSLVNSPTFGSTGKTGTCYNFAQSSSQYVNFGNVSAWNAMSAITIQTWCKPTTWADGNQIFTKQGVWKICDANPWYYMHVSLNSGDKFAGFHTDPSSSVWTSLVGTWRTSDGQHIFYINGSVDNSITSTGTMLSNEAGYNSYAGIGSTYWHNNWVDFYDGLIDEVRISNIARSNTWITTEYNNQNSTSTFMTVGGEQTNWYNTSWLYRQKITIDHNKVDADQVNFPVLVSKTMNTSKVQSTGNDILFTSGAGVKLNHEIESYNSTTGMLVAWVNVTSVSSTLPDTYFYMYYGNSSSQNQQNVTGTWDSNYQMVQHMNDRTTSTISDSTSNKNNGTKVSADHPLDSAGKFGRDQDFTPNDYISVADIAALASTQTVSMWVKPTFSTSMNQYVLDEGGNIYSVQFYDADNNNGLPVITWDATILTGTYELATSDIWYKIDCTVSGSALIAYVNGASYGTGTRAASTPGDIKIGSYAASIQRTFDGPIDEIRVSTVARSATWISTEYKSQNDPTNFTLFSAEEQYAGAGGGSNSPPNTPTGLGPTTRQIAPSVTIYATATDPNGDAITMYFYNNATQTEIGHASGASGSNISVTWSGLSQGTSYSFYAVAFDSQAWSANSSVCTFTTNAPPTITGLMTENLTDPNRITSFIPYFNWTYTDNNSDTQVAYQIQVGTTQNGSNLWDSGNVTSSSTNVKYNGTSLSRSTLYYVRIRGYDGYEWSTW